MRGGSTTVRVVRDDVVADVSVEVCVKVPILLDVGPSPDLRGREEDRMVAIVGLLKVRSGETYMSRPR